METQYDFDDIVNRRNTNCGRWDTMDKKYGTRDMIHLGVADMDFRAPVEIRDSLHKILDMGVLGYTDLSDKFFLSIQRWYKKQYNMDIPREWIVFCPRINIASTPTRFAIAAAVRSLSPVIITTFVIPARFNELTTASASSRRGSSIQITPANFPSIARYR